MGFPLSRFQQLSALCRGHSHEFASFKILAIVVHGRDNYEIRRQIQYHFEHLHAVTGDAMAFIAFVEPPARWKRDHEHWMNLKESLSAGGETGSDEVLLRNLQERLCLPDSPCILLTNDLLSDRYLVLPIEDSGEILSQLEAIGRFANRPGARVRIDDDVFLRFLDTLGNVYEGATDNAMSLAKNIADLSAVKDLSSPYPGCKRARDWVRSEFERLRERILTADEEDRSARQFDYAEFLLYVICNSTGAPLSMRDDLRIDSEKLAPLEEASDRYISSYNLIAPALAGPMRWGLDSLTRKTIDFSALGTYLGKVLEEEVNASLFQYLRSLAGIAMPEFYRKYDRNAGPYPLQTRYCKVFLNNARPNFEHVPEPVPDKMFPPGNIIYAVRTQMKSWPELQRFGQNGVLDRIHDFSSIRNDAAHPGNEFGIQAARRIREQFLELNRTVFPILNQLKAELKAENQMHMG